MRKVLWIVVSVAALLFAIEGGEYGTRDLLRQRRRKAHLTAAIDSLTRVVDSLKRYEALVERDPATQERIAREEFGMVRGDKELLYRFTDSTAAPDAKR